MGERSPAISVALATYNGAQFLEEQLESLAGQHLLPFELVVADDRSTDATVAILNDFARRAPFPMHIHVNTDRLGYRRNFRRAAQLCRGELISFCDQDDIWLPAKLATVAAPFADPAVLMVYHNVRLIDRDGTLMGRLYDIGVEQAKLRQKPLPPQHFSFGLTQTFRTVLRDHDDLWNNSVDHLQEEILAHDQWYIFLALALGTVRFLDADLILYRQHGGNAYGSGGVRTPLQRLMDRFVHDALYDRFGSASAASKAAILAEIQKRVGQDTDLSPAIAHYDLLSHRLARRHAFYTRPCLADRLFGLARSVGAGDYCGNPWGFDWKSIPRDLVTGVVRGGSGTP